MSLIRIPRGNGEKMSPADWYAYRLQIARSQAGLAIGAITVGVVLLALVRVRFGGFVLIGGVVGLINSARGWREAHREFMASQARSSTM